MKAIVGSTNENKVRAVRELFAGVPALCDYEVVGLAIQSGVPEQPLSRHDMRRGARNRALGAFAWSEHQMGIGIESGVFGAGHWSSSDDSARWALDATMCVIITPAAEVIGMSSAWPVPEDVAELLYGPEKLDMNQAFKRLGYTAEEKLGHGAGASSILSGGRLTRQEMARQAVLAALMGTTGYLRLRSRRSECRGRLGESPRPFAIMRTPAGP